MVLNIIKNFHREWELGFLEASEGMLMIPLSTKILTLPLELLITHPFVSNLPSLQILQLFLLVKPLLKASQLKRLLRLFHLSG